MKKQLLVVLGLTISIFAQATTPDSVTVKKPRPKPLAKERTFLAYDFNFLSNSGSGIKTAPIRSGGITAAVFYDKPLGRSPISLAIGLGFSSFNIHSKSALAKDSVGSYFVKYSDSVSSNIKRNKLSLNYLEIPIEIRFRSKPNTKNQSVKFAIGFKVGYLIQSHWKYKGDDLSTPVKDVIKIKTFDIPNISPFRYGITARVGFGMFNVYGFYSLQGIFNNNKLSHGQPNSQPLTIGIAVTPY
jgi:hypothetical protein